MSEGRRVALVTLGLAAVFVPMALFRVIDADEGIYLLNAKVVLGGKVPYLDFLYPQMPLLPYVYAAWSALFGVSWYAARTLSSLFAIALGLLVYHHVTTQTRRPRFGLLAVALFALTGLSLTWFTVIKTYSLAMLLLFAAYALVMAETGRSRALWAGLCLGLAVDVRLYVGVAAVPLALEILRPARDGGDRARELGRFLVGLAIALTPSLVFLLAAGADVFTFNVLGVHGIRSNDGLVGSWAQKVDLVFGLLGVTGSYGATSLQCAILACLNAAAVLAGIGARKPLSPSLQVALWLGAASLIPTPTYAQYFCLVLPFLVVNAVLYLADIDARTATLDTRMAPAFAPLRTALAPLFVVLLAAYLLAGPRDAYLYTAGEMMPYLNPPARTAEWTIPTIREISKAIDRETASSDGRVITWWPGYLVESRATILPRLENPYAVYYSARLTPAERDRYRFMSNEELLARIRGHDVPIVVLGAWMGAGKPLLRQFLAGSGYVMRARVGETEIYRFEAAPRSALIP